MVIMNNIKKNLNKNKNIDKKESRYINYDKIKNQLII